MNTPSPLNPQGATPARGKSSLYFNVMMILSIHVVVIGGMLLQGCNATPKETPKTDTAATTTPDTSPAPTAPAPGTTAAPVADVPSTLNPNVSNAYTGSSPAPAPATTLTPSTSMTSVVPPAKSSDLTPTVAQGEYVIAKGDTMGAIARKSGISLKALVEANPSANAKKLQIGQKLQIPAAAAAVAAATPAGTIPTATAEADGSLYVVKSGDMLGKIAKNHGTTVKKIMALNELKTTSIRAGQKLKLPTAKTTTAETTASPATASLSPAMPALSPAPVKVSTAAPATTASPVAAN